MNAALSTTAWVLHDLGLATSVGGALFGKAGLQPAERAIREGESGLITNDAWRRFSPFNLVSHVAVVLTWLTGRSALTGRIVDRDTRRLVRAKDGLIGAYLATGLASTGFGYALSKARYGTTRPAESGASAEATRDDDRVRGLQRASDLFGYANLLAGAAAIGLTTALAMKSGRSMKGSLFSRFLP